jgi:phosphatidylglycerophosphate synthase
MSVPSIPRLRVLCQRDKLRRKDDLTRRHRAVSIYATALLLRTGVTADQVTVASVVTGLLGAVALGASGLAAGLAAVALLYVSFLLDQVDGEVARYRGRTSLRGVYLDELRHLVIYAAPVFALAFDVSRDATGGAGAAWPFAVGFAGALALTLARAEERLPALIFGERAAALLVPTVGAAVSGAGAPPALDGRDARRHAVTSLGGAGVPPALLPGIRVALRAVHATYEALTHQVLILIWLLVAVTFERGLGLGPAEGVLLVSLSLVSALALAATIAARARPGAIEADVQARAAAARAALTPPTHLENGP